MTALAAYRPRLDGLLAHLAAEHGPPGAACGVLLGDEFEIATWGVTNITTGAPVIPATLFQLGSITKVYTATPGHAGGQRRGHLARRAGAGPAPGVHRRRPRCHDRDHARATCSPTRAASRATTSSTPAGTPTRCRRYVATLAGLGQIHPTDEAYSFCNTGYAVAGRLLEVATGEHFDRVLRRRLARPLGCRATLTLPQHALAPQRGGRPRPGPGGPATRQARWALTRSNGPMGGVMAPPGRAADLRPHAHGGRRGPDGADLLAPAAVDAMQRPHAETPVPGEEQALGWTVTRWDDLVCLGLDADTFGQRAMLRVVPERGVAVCVMANSPTGAPLAQQLIERVAADLLDADAAPRPRPGAGPPGAEVPPASALAGTYDRLHQRIVVSAASEAGGSDGAEGARIVLETEPSGVLQALGVGHARLEIDVVELDDHPAGPRTVCSGRDPVSGQLVAAVFTPATEAQPAGVYLAGRLHRRIA